MKIGKLSIITENQNHFWKAENLADLISNRLATENSYQINKYHKFNNSYQLEFTLHLENPESSMIESLVRTNKICSPWTVKLVHNESEVELTFTKSLHSTYSIKEFNVIIWGNWQVEKSHSPS